jgi:YHS domain-containing protein
MPSVAAEKVLLAINGYDPVAYFATGKPAPGLPTIEYEWDEHRYRFSRVEHRDLFKADPVRYAPQFTNYCAMALARGEVHEANPEYWLVSGGKLYLFGGPSGWERFQQDPAGNIPKASDNRELLRRR